MSDPLRRVDKYWGKTTGGAYAGGVSRERREHKYAVSAGKAFPLDR
jgi:hypothetical protein